MFSVELKIKRVTLADEARNIRKEETRALLVKDTVKYENLHYHRLQVVRPAARAAHLAHTYLRGALYRTVERNARLGVPLDDVVGNLKRFGGYTEEKKELRLLVISWVDGGTPVGERNSKSAEVGSTPTAA